jgi:VWA domain-containing protein
VVDHRGVVPSDLTSDNFKVTYKDQTIKLLNAIYTKAPRRVVVLLDVSGSMTGKWQVARAAAWDFVATLQPGSRASLMTFSEKAEIETALSPNLKVIQDWVTDQATRPPKSFHGRTALFAAIQSAVAELQPTEPGDAIYVISDGGENASRMSRPKVEEALRSAGVRLFGLIIPSRFFAVEEERVGTLEFADLSKQSGGFVETLGLGNSPSEFGEPVVYDKLMEDQVWLRSRQVSLEIESFYAIELQLPDNPDKKQRLEIRVVDGRGHNRKDLLQAYPRKVSTCRIESAWQ